MAGGARNPVFLARRGEQRLVARVSGRSGEALAWELDLLDTLRDAGVVVPQTVATDDGRRHDGGVLVQRFIAGGPPRDRRDWDRVVAALTVVHEATVGWPQRPGFASARDLLHLAGGGDVLLSAMPNEAVALVRASWQPLVDGIDCAIHGDLGQGNVLVTDDYVSAT